MRVDLPMTIVVVTLESIEHWLKLPRHLEIDGFARQRPVDGTTDNDRKVHYETAASSACTP
jgi:hypothetical protein